MLFSSTSSLARFRSEGVRISQSESPRFRSGVPLGTSRYAGASSRLPLTQRRLSATPGVVKVKGLKTERRLPPHPERSRMPRENLHNLVLNLQQVRKQEALQQALLVPWRQLDATVGEYVQWHSLVLWVRTISESAGELPSVLRSE